MITEKEYKEALSELTDLDKRIAKAREVVEKYKKQSLAELKDVVKILIEGLMVSTDSTRIHVEKIENKYLGAGYDCGRSFRRMSLVVEYELTDNIE